LHQKLTKKYVENLSPGTSDQIIWDTEIAGFGVKVTPTGKRSYFVKYRVGGGRNGRQRKPSIGVHGIITCIQARQIAQDWLSEARAGRDPLQARQSSSKAETLAMFCDIYVERHIVPHLKEKTQKDYAGLLAQHILPNLGKLSVRSISRPDILKLHTKMSKTPYQANRVLALLSSLFNRAEEWGYRVEGTNPCRHVIKFKETSRDRSLSETEITILERKLKTMEIQNPYPVAFVRLALLTGARKNEILHLKWSDVDLIKGKMLLRDSKTGRRSISLNSPAISVLESLPRIYGNPYVLPGAKANSHLVNVNKFWARVRKQAQIGDVRIHDLRHTFASIGVSNGLSLSLVGELLGHKNPSTTNRYAHLADKSVRNASEAIGQAIVGGSWIQTPEQRASDIQS